MLFIYVYGDHRNRHVLTHAFPTRRASVVVCDGVIAIRQEIRAFEEGRWPVEQSPLRHAPHTVDDAADEQWSRPYSRREGCFPSGSSTDKYWPPVNRIDNSYGDRNLVCSCPPLSDYAEAAE